MSKIQTLADEFIATKSQKSFKALADRLRPGILTKISALVNDYDEMQEIANITFAKAWSNIHQYNKDAGAFSTWIYRIAWNECLLSKRHTNRTKSLDSMLDEGTVAHSNISEDANFEYFDEKSADETKSELYEKTINAIYSMPDEGKDGLIKTAFIKWHIDKKPYREIALEMNIPENTAKNKVFRGKKMLKEILTKSEPLLVQKYNEIHV